MSGPLSRPALAAAAIDLFEHGWCLLDSHEAAVQLAAAIYAPGYVVAVERTLVPGWWRVTLTPTQVERPAPGLSEQLGALGYDLTITSPPWDDR